MSVPSSCELFWHIYLRWQHFGRVHFFLEAEALNYVSVYRIKRIVIGESKLRSDWIVASYSSFRLREGYHETDSGV